MPAKEVERSRRGAPLLRFHDLCGAPFVLSVDRLEDR
jgi:hypothetical protein